MKPKPEDTANRRTLFAELYERFSTDLPSWLRRFRVPASDDQDAVQEALESMYVNASALISDERGARVACLGLANVVAHRLRRHAKRRAGESGEVEGTSHQDLEAQLALYQALERLDEDQRAAVIASDVYGLPDHEVAVSLGKSERTVRRLLQEARRRLRAAMVGAVVVPLASLGLDPVQRAAFAALLRAEGKAPFFLVGGPSDPPPSPPPPPPPSPVPLSVPAAAAKPVPWAALAGAGLVGCAATLVVVVLVLFKAPTDERLDTAQTTGLRSPQTAPETEESAAALLRSPPPVARTRARPARPATSPSSRPASAVSAAPAASSRRTISEQERLEALEVGKGKEPEFIHPLMP